MKIISQPDLSGWSIRHSCKDCSAELEIEANDISYYHHESDGIYPSTDTYSTNCAVCSAPISIQENMIPKVIQIRLQSKSRISRR